MTDIKDTLAALSEAATDMDRAAAQALCASGWTHAIAAFAEHRRNVITEALRSGQLVPVPSVLVVARAMYDTWPAKAYSSELAQQADTSIGGAMSWEKVVELGGNHDGLIRLATAVIAAMKGKGRGDG